MARVIGFGEAMIRYTPLETQERWASSRGKLRPSGLSNCLRSVGGDELNVCVDFCRLGGNRSASWVSTLPNLSNQLARIVRDVAEDANVDLSYCHNSKSPYDIGAFSLLPSEKTVHYSRKDSAFWVDQPNEGYNWEKIFSLSGEKWLHATGITPLCGSQAVQHWIDHLKAAAAAKVPVFIDLNHRPALGTIEKLWGIMCEAISVLGHSLKFLMFSLKTLRQCAELSGLEEVPDASVFEISGGVPEASKSDDATNSEKSNADTRSPCWPNLLERLQIHLCKNKGMDPSVVLGCCFKERALKGNLQTRWSVLSRGQNNTFSTLNTPVIHSPKDECGGGSAWAAGCIDCLTRFPDLARQDLAFVARRGDLLAALCQEEVGDHSNTSETVYDAVASRFEGTTAYIGDCAARLNQTQSKRNSMSATIDSLGKSRVLAILRAKNADVAISRGIELVNELGATALEVTLDTAEFPRVLSSLVTAVGHKAEVGVGTVMRKEELAQVAQLGATFALSPVNPEGFVQTCLELGIVPVPAAYTPTECWKAYTEGAAIVKLFPAQQWRPEILKAMLGTGALGDMKIVPSGGVTPETAQSWFDAGAFAVGMGSNLCGKDIKVLPQDKEKLNAAKKLWAEEGREKAREIIRLCRVE